MKYITKDSGKRVEFKSGMRRDVQEGKPRYDLIPYFAIKRLAELYARGAEKYGDSNWQLANSKEEHERFKASGLRHTYQFFNGEVDEDHMAGAMFNLIAYEFLNQKLSETPTDN